MPSVSVTQVQHGPLICYLACLEGDPDLLRFVGALPPDRPVMWLDSARHPAATGAWSLVGYDPWMTLIARGDRIEWRTSATTQRWQGHPLEALRGVLRRYDAGSAVGQPYAKAVGLLGYLSYELNRWIERLPPSAHEGLALPEMLWFGMRVNLLVDHRRQRSWIVSIVDPHAASQGAAHREALTAAHHLIEAWEDLCRRIEPAAPGFQERQPPPGVGGASWYATSTQAAFEAMVERALEDIRAGEIFQANLAQRFTMPWSARPFPLYHALRRINPSPFACFLSWENLAVISSSPERLVRVQDGRVETRPIAGTRSRGMTAVDDAMSSLELLLSEKERAEHLMLVDLARNDVGRVCVMGSVRVDEFMTVEAYSHVLHIVSNVVGNMRPGLDAIDVIRSLFPGGTITGCPKIRSMQIIQELEPVPRGLYTGSLGCLGFDGAVDLNIAIRTMVIHDRQLSLHVGAGIVADSHPQREYQETLAKAAALLGALRMVGDPSPAISQVGVAPIIQDSRAVPHAQTFHAGS